MASRWAVVLISHRPGDARSSACTLATTFRFSTPRTGHASPAVHMALSVLVRDSLVCWRPVPTHAKIHQDTTHADPPNVEQPCFSHLPCLVVLSVGRGGGVLSVGSSRTMSEYSRAGPVLQLAAAVMAPLIATLAPEQHAALAVGSVAALSLVKMTFANGALSATSEKREAQAARDVVMTSNSNRLARLVLGLTFMFASVTFALRWSDAGNLRTQLVRGEASAFGVLGMAWVGCFVDSFFGGVWLSTAVDGQ